MGKSLILVAAVVVIVPAVSSLSADVLYHVADLGTLGRGHSSARSINNKGQIVGDAYTTDEHSFGPHPALFDPTGDGNNVDLVPNEHCCGYAYSINAAGQIAGRIGNRFCHESRATLFDPTGEGNNIDLGVPGDEGDWASEALSINNAGEMVGRIHYVGMWTPPFPPPSVLSYATLFDGSGNGAHVNLGTLGGDWSEAYSINNNGQIVGMARTGDSKYRATLFDSTDPGNNINLGTLPGGGDSSAVSINGFGQITGHVRDGSGRSRAVLFDPNGTGANLNLGTLPGMEESWANSINNAGQIVGASYSFPNDHRATLFDLTGQGNNINLNDVIPPDPVWRLEEAQCINDSGWIVGYGKNAADERHAFLLRPVSSDDLTLTVGIEPNDVGIDTVMPGPGEHKYLRGKAVDIEAHLFKACPKIYHFDHWEGGVVEPNLPLTTVIMDEDKAITGIYVAAEPKCGDECHPILQGDLNGDCYVNFTDFVLYSDKWMSCTHPDCD